MQIKNTSKNYGLISILLHWGMALVVVALFALGLWMRGLSYYDEWYRIGPDVHKSVGILLAIALLLRIIWRCFNVRPDDAETLKRWEQYSAHIVHYLLYVLLMAIVLSGYLISTADGRPVEVFGWFAVPAMGELFDNQEDLAGQVHEYLAYSVIILALLHALAALKHHFIDKDNTLKKMLCTHLKGAKK